MPRGEPRRRRGGRASLHGSQTRRSQQGKSRGRSLLKGACAGGPGSKGGSGVDGGNGTGGHAIGVAYTISAPVIQLDTGSSVELGGSGGDMNAVNVSEQEFPL